MEINWGSRLLLTSLFQLEREGRSDGHFKTDYGGQGLEAVRNRRSYSALASMDFRSGCCFTGWNKASAAGGTGRMLYTGLDHPAYLNPSETLHGTGEEIWSLHP